ncbi:hypothetical protein JP75_10770 [Devosia riboflavina]|uniref:Uncharacterized protein n=1 Tax=Devosia riboflavina TaxID=46914 RepID=A0A087M3A0_9HYPH|nr:hypothetical protein JP75_10770 [Devosia riboflavina]
MRGFLQPDHVPSVVVTTGLVPVVQGRPGIAWIAGTSPAMTTGVGICGVETEVPAFAGMTPWTREIFDV